MFLATYEYRGRTEIGVLTDDKLKVIPLQAANPSLPATMNELIAQGDKALELVKKVKAAAGAPMIDLAAVKLLAPIPRPQRNIFCIGKNYHEHALEFGKFENLDAAKSVPQYPIIFSKLPTTVIGPDAVVDSHSDVTSQLDYEAELGVIIGKKGTKIAREEAMDYVFGYTVINDVTARDLQKRHAQWLLGKGLDTFCPMGPFLVHKSAVTDVTKLEISLKVNGERRQNANTSALIFDIPEIIRTISAGITLEPGDIIATGTPAGVALGFNPPKFLHKGDVVEIEISEVGHLKNTIG